MAEQASTSPSGLWDSVSPKNWSLRVGIEVPVCLSVLLFYLAIFIFPFLFAVFLSFHNWDFIGNRVPVGLDNFQRILHDPRFWGGLVISVKFAAIFIGVGSTAQLALAVGLYSIRSHAGLHRILLAFFFLPSITPWVASIVVWRWIFWPTGGLFNAVLGLVGIPRQPLISGNTQALYCITLIMIWRYLGYGAVIILAGLNEIPESLYEAARIDGASFWRQFFMITLPLLQPVLLFLLVISVIGLLQTFEPFYLITKGGPGHSTRALPLYIYNKAFDNYNFGYASALSLILFLVLLVFTAIQLRTLRPRWEY